MTNKSNIVAGLHFGTEFFIELFKQVKKLGGTEECIYDTLKTNSPVITEIAKLIVGVKKLALKSLSFVKNVVIEAEESLKSFFTGKSNFWFGDNFKSLILSQIPETIPAFSGTLSKLLLTKPIYDSEMQAETDSKPFSVAEFAAIIRHLILSQPNGEDGDLLNNGYGNIFHVQLGDNRVVAVRVDWDSCRREWVFRANDFDIDGWSGGYCLFVRN